MALNNVVLWGVTRVKMSETGVCALWSEAGLSIRRFLLISGFSPLQLSLLTCLLFIWMLPPRQPGLCPTMVDRCSNSIQSF